MLWLLPAGSRRYSARNEIAEYYFACSVPIQVSIARARLAEKLLSRATMKLGSMVRFSGGSLEDVSSMDWMS